MAEALNGSERALIASAISAQEEERKRIAREIHDGPAQTLASLVFRIEIIQKLMDIDQEKARDELDRLKDALRLSLNDVRKIIYDLRPLVIEEEGLSTALEKYIDTWEEKSKISSQFSWKARKDERFPYEVENTLFRIVQESLTNVAKYSEATFVKVVLERESSGCRIMVEDNGKGFDLSQLDQNSKARPRFGLAGMRERVQLLGGIFSIDSAPEAGTKISISLPFNVN